MRTANRRDAQLQDRPDGSIDNTTKMNLRLAAAEWLAATVRSQRR
jgi:hypothetical protein